MKELVTVEQAEQVIRLAAIILPLAGLVVGGVVGLARRRMLCGLLAGLLCGLAGPAVLLMWRIYNVIVGRYGLDSVKALVINLALFAAVGSLVGLAVGVVARRRRAARSGADAAARHPSS